MTDVFVFQREADLMKNFIILVGSKKNTEMNRGHPKKINFLYELTMTLCSNKDRKMRMQIKDIKL